MFKRFYLHGLQRNRFYVVLLGSTISRKTHAKFINKDKKSLATCVFDLTFMEITRTKCPNEDVFSKPNA